jgi:hypothetical protein
MLRPDLEMLKIVKSHRYFFAGWTQTLDLVIKRQVFYHFWSLALQTFSPFSLPWCQQRSSGRTPTLDLRMFRRVFCRWPNSQTLLTEDKYKIDKMFFGLKVAAASIFVAN